MRTGVEMKESCAKSVRLQEFRLVKEIPEADYSYHIFEKPKSSAHY